MVSGGAGFVASLCAEGQRLARMNDEMSDRKRPLEQRERWRLTLGEHVEKCRQCGTALMGDLWARWHHGGTT